MSINVLFLLKGKSIFSLRSKKHEKKKLLTSTQHVGQLMDRKESPVSGEANNLAKELSIHLG